LCAFLAAGCGRTTKSKWITIKESKAAINLASVERISLGHAPNSLRRQDFRTGELIRSGKVRLWMSSGELSLDFETEQMAELAYDQISDFLTNGSDRLEVTLGNSR
jgi:hypothetical protein